MIVCIVCWFIVHCPLIVLCFFSSGKFFGGEGQYHMCAKHCLVSVYWMMWQSGCKDKTQMWKNSAQVWGSMFEFCATGCVLQCRAKLLQLCPTVCHPVDRSLPASSLHRILQVRILECTPKLSQLYSKYKIKVFKSRWGMFVHNPSTPSIS